MPADPTAKNKAELNSNTNEGSHVPAQHNQNSVQEKQQKQDTSTNTADSPPKSADQKIQILDKHAIVFRGKES